MSTAPLDPGQASGQLRPAAPLDPGQASGQLRPAAPLDPGQASGQLRPAAPLDPGQASGQLRPAAPLVTMYTTSWCGYCVRLKRHMTSEGIDFAEVNIESDPAAADLVQKANGGNQTVPTLIFPDGTALTNPTIEQVKSQLAAA